MNALLDALKHWKDDSGEECTHERCIHKDKKLRDKLSQKQVDKMVKDSFPASDPPSTY